MFDLLGVDMPPFAKFFVAFATVLILIGLVAWLVRRFGANRLGGSGARGRQPRLAVIDAATVDGRRRLVLIRRDNVEHLLMIGGPSDLVVEPNIVRVQSRDAAREPVPPSRPQENIIPLQPVNEPPPPPQPTFTAPPAPPAPAPRPYRSATEEPWLPPEPGARPRPSEGPTLTGLAAELSTRLQPPPVSARAELRPEPRPEPPRPAPPAPPPVVAEAPTAAPPQSDHNLAEMAQQLEAALRRAPMPEGRPPVTDPLAVPPAKSSGDKPRLEPKLDLSPKADEPKMTPPRPEPRFEAPKPEPKAAVKPEAKPDAGAAAGKTVYDSLEEEMASLLGRPPGKP